jgi:peptide/nickel transport system permease protein
MAAPLRLAFPGGAGLRRRASGALGHVGGIAVTLFMLVALTFVIGRLLPIDPVLSVVGSDADQATYDQVRRELGLDRPLVEQFAIFAGSILSLDFGTALLTDRPVLEDLARVFPATIELATVTILLGAGIGVPLGIAAAVNRGRLPDHLVRVLSLLGYSTPIFWLGLLGLLVFYARLGWVGGSGRVELYYVDIVPERTGLLLVDALLARDLEVFWSAVRHIVLPASVLGYAAVAYISRMTRSFMLEQLGQEYVVAARAKGVPYRAVVWRHAFKNIRVQVVTIVALSYGGMLEGAVLIETVFGWPGFGQYLTNALLIGDMNAVVASTLLVGLIFIALNVLADLLYRVFDPRTR